MSASPSTPAAPTAEAPLPTPFLRRTLRAACLHADTYEEVEADRRSIGQATLLVALCSASAAIGATGLRRELLDASSRLAVPELLHVGVAAVEPLVLWIVTGALAYMIGATFLRGPETETDYAEVLRTTGFAFGPGVLLGLAAVVPVSSGAVVVTVLLRLWILLAWVVAIRQALDYTTARAIGTSLFAFVLGWLLLWGLVVAI